MVGLIPPGRGIRATLTSSGVHTWSSPSTAFQDTVIRRDPESVGLTSPVAASGVFELDAQSDMRLPFEGTGLDTSWEVRLPRAANPFDYRSIGDILVTIDYTAYASDDYARQVIEQLNRTGRLRTDQDHAFRLRQEFPDEWYRLHNPDGDATTRDARVELSGDDFPANLDDVTVQDVIVYITLLGDTALSGPGVALHHAGAGGDASLVDGIASTRRGNAPTWSALRGGSPAGIWELSFSAAAAELFDADGVEDVLLVIGCAGASPRWVV